MSELALAIRILRSEGALALRDRMTDRLADGLRRSRVPHLDLDAARRLLTPFRPAVLNISPVPPAPARGGAQAQMLDRLTIERLSRPVALAYPRGDRLVLEVHHGSRSGIVSSNVGRPDSHSFIALAASLGAKTVHLENPAGLPLELLPRLAAARFSSIVSLHDFSLFCRRPHLIEGTTGAFCGYCRDDHRCRACLAIHDEPTDADQPTYRRRGVDVLRAADHVVFPSDFLRRQYADLFPSVRDDGSSVVIPPATRLLGSARRRSRTVPVVAFVGGACRHKGGHLFREVAERVRRETPTARFVCFGNGEGDILADLRQSRIVHVRGYYRRGGLPRLLAKTGTEVAVFASIWPETYGLTVDECLRAGVPVVAFDHGAVGDRARDVSGLHVVGLDQGSPGLASTVREVLTGARGGVDPMTTNRFPTPCGAALRIQELYQLAEASHLGAREG